MPVIEDNGEFFACDHFVDAAHRLGNIRSTRLVELLDSPRQKAFGQAKWDTLRRCCRARDLRAMCNGGCPKNRLVRTAEGEIGLDYPCAGYKHFLRHCEACVAATVAAWRRQQMPDRRTTNAQTGHKAGRNDPCPCCSGKKYKKCRQGT
ncbi:MAG: SPASM domain-containing protein [Phycisphaerales bacterium]|nr:MAG: SPASM domain-containing protein [Phycisphaerales bacterium]